MSLLTSPLATVKTVLKCLFVNRVVRPHLNLTNESGHNIFKIKKFKTDSKFVARLNVVKFFYIK